METIISSIISIIMLFIGFSVGFLISKNDIKKLLGENNDLKEKNEILQSKLLDLTKENSIEKTKLDMIDELQKLVKEDFTSIANKVIKAEQSDLREQNKEALEEKLKPLRENFELFRNKIEEFNKQGETNTATIKTQIETLLKESFSIKNTAIELSNAIKANSQVRGYFGELILENLLQQAGLIDKDKDFEKGNYVLQHVFQDKNNPTERPRPDAVVFFPNNKNIIIDSKCPLNNFIEYINMEGKEEKEQQLKLFYKSVTDMIDDLSKKYNHLDGLNTPDFKLMFIPLEACSSYIYGNQSIIDKAAKMNIIMVCPSTLLATLKIINKTWQEKVRAEKLKDIINTATLAYNKLSVFIKKAEEIRKNMNGVLIDFEELFKTAQGQGGLIKQISKLEELGLNTTKKIDEKYTKDDEKILEK